MGHIAQNPQPTPGKGHCWRILYRKVPVLAK